VTHDQVEAMTMADKIVVLRDGIIEQVGTPIELYRKPRNLFVAEFIGSPKMNVVNGAEAEKLGAPTIGIRPEHIKVSKTAPKSGNSWKGKVGVSEHLGSDTFLHMEVEGIGTVNVRADGEVDLHHGDTAWLSPEKSRIHKFDSAGLAI